ncbi:MAG: diaminopimelate epimerase [Alphaproteobacteria bacterium]
MTIRFTKMHGLGNDFVILDCRKARHGLDSPAAAGPAGLSPDRARRIADRRRGIGCDQVIVLNAAPDASACDAVLDIFNPDGSRAEACGNATRCVAALLGTELDRTRIILESAGRLLNCLRLEDGRVSVDMGPPRFEWDAIPLAEPVNTSALDLGVDTANLGTGTAVSMGNPHCVFFTEHLDTLPIETLGPALEHHALFPERANIGFARIVDRHTIRLRVWERGAGLTSACGSGACAAAVGAIRRGLTDGAVDLELDGGILSVTWREGGSVTMTGPVAMSFEGIFRADDHPLAEETP